jgi:hypothetical protein
MSREVGRFGGEGYEIGIYELDEADADEGRSAGDIELVWFDLQDYSGQWPFVIPRSIFENLAQSLFETMWRLRLRDERR